MKIMQTFYLIICEDFREVPDKYWIIVSEILHCTHQMNQCPLDKDKAEDTLF